MTERTWTTAEALSGAAWAMQMCAAERPADDAEQARAAVIAYLNLTGRDAEAAEVARAALEAMEAGDGE